MDIFHGWLFPDGTGVEEDGGDGEALESLDTNGNFGCIVDVFELVLDSAGFIVETRATWGRIASIDSALLNRKNLGLMAMPPDSGREAAVVCTLLVEASVVFGSLARAILSGTVPVPDAKPFSEAVSGPTFASRVSLLVFLASPPDAEGLWSLSVDGISSIGSGGLSA